MGHAINYFTVDKESDIMKVAENYARHNTDMEENPSGSYHGNMTVHKYDVCESYEDAEDYIERHDRGFYDDHAVRFKDKSGLKPTKQMENIKAKADKMTKERAEYYEAHSIKNRKSEFAGCKNCGSKISIKHLRGDRCPVCGTDLRAEYIIERLKKYNKDITSLDDQYVELHKKQSGKCPIRWLVKVEVHC